MYDEMRFLFQIDPYIKNYKKTSSSVTNSDGDILSSYQIEELNDDDKKIYLNNYIVTKNDVKNYIKSDVNKLYENNTNPYIDLIKFTNEEGTAKSLKLTSSDFAYLRDIGVMPINRLMILRRFPAGVTVPVDLNDLNVEPIATVVGWVKNDTNLLNFSFNENWVKQGSGDMLHLMLNKIIKDEFVLDISSSIPIPVWGKGFLFGLLNKMGLTDYRHDVLPIGDPNLLKESITRDHESFGLSSNFNFTLETVYEQKYIAGIDPTVITFDILDNLLKMGTSNVNVLGRPGSEFVKLLKKANNNPTNANGWIILVEYIVKTLLNTLQETIKKNFSELSQLLGVSKKDEDNNSSIDMAGSNQLEQINKVQSALNSPFVKSILASTLARYQWPLRGSVAMFTGEANTPWHLTIGNPYAPLLSMNNIYLKGNDVTFGSEMLFNDIPKTIEVKLSMEQGRNLGKQEIYKLFGVAYKRRYNKAK